VAPAPSCTHGCSEAARPAAEIADIVRRHGEAFRRCHQLTADQHRVLSAIEHCRTPALGGHLDVCQDCGHQRPSYNSCRDRHCPKCQALAQARWIAGRMQRLLPVGYFHVVFALPAALRPLALRNRRRVFRMLMSCAAHTLLELGRDPERLGAQLGVTVVLHTWTRELGFHPHVHCIVTGGGLSPGDDQWVRAPKRYLFPVRVMADLFRGKLLAAMKHAQQRGQLQLDPRLPPGRFHDTIDRLHRTQWVTYAKRPFGGPEQVLRYLGRYTHRVGISNQRLVACDGDGVTFHTKAGKRITLAPDEFLRRFLCHVLPKRFVKIRHYGLLAPCHATTALERARAVLLSAAEASPQPRGGASATAVDAMLTSDWRTLLQLLTGVDLSACPACGSPNLTCRTIPRPISRGPPS